MLHFQRQALALTIFCASFFLVGFDVFTYEKKYTHSIVINEYEDHDKTSELIRTIVSYDPAYFHYHIPLLSQFNISPETAGIRLTQTEEGLPFIQVISNLRNDFIKENYAKLNQDFETFFKRAAKRQVEKAPIISALSSKNELWLKQLLSDNATTQLFDNMDDSLKKQITSEQLSTLANNLEQYAGKVTQINYMQGHTFEAYDQNPASFSLTYIVIFDSEKQYRFTVNRKDDGNNYPVIGFYYQEN